MYNHFTEDIVLSCSILIAEMISLFILKLFGCNMKGKYWYSLFFILSFSILFSLACILYFSFNPLDNDTVKQNQATDIIYIFSGVATLLAPLVLIWTIDSWKDSYNTQKLDSLLSERVEICSSIKEYILYKLSERVYISKKNILNLIDDYNYEYDIEEFYSKIDASYYYIIQDLSKLSTRLNINRINLKKYEVNDIKLQADLIYKVNSLVTPYGDFKQRLWDHTNNKTLNKLLKDFDEIGTWDILNDKAKRSDIIQEINSLILLN